MKFERKDLDKMNNVELAKYLIHTLDPLYENQFPNSFSNPCYMKLSNTEIIKLYEEAILTNTPVPYEKLYDFNVDEYLAREEKIYNYYMSQM